MTTVTYGYSSEPSSAGWIPAKQGIQETKVSISKEVMQRSAGALADRVYNSCVSEDVFGTIEASTLCMQLVTGPERGSGFGVLNLLDIPRAKFAGMNPRERQDEMRKMLRCLGVMQGTAIATSVTLKNKVAGRNEASVAFGGVIALFNPYNKPFAQFTELVWDVPDPLEDAKHISSNPTVSSKKYGFNVYRPFARPADPTNPTDALCALGTSTTRFDPLYQNGVVGVELGLR
jgi:hypothetical protein